MMRRPPAFALSLAAALAVALFAAPAFGQQLHSELVVDGLQRPVAFVQDPSQTNVQFVVEQRGRIRPVVNGHLVDSDFLNISGDISTAAEGGLLGLAFAPDYASSGRFYVNFTDPNDNTVIARFTRAAGDSMHADPGTRFDLVWSDGNNFIAQPYCCHYGGHLAFGPDGYLYIALGDGGAWDDPDNNAQNPGSLLGKILRIDVSVSDSDPSGYAVPPDNPFVGQDGVRGEIWDAGLRNPWRYSFDDAVGGTGALVLGDVGQDTWEEVDFEPAGHGGRNYGWRNREGANDYITTVPPWFEPLTDPIYEYEHDGGRAVIGGYVYRGDALAPSFKGRYFFGDFMTGQLWSMGLNIDPGTGEATAGDLQEHTVDIGPEPLDYFTAFGRDAAGELYVVSWWHGTVFKIANGPPPPPPPPHNVILSIDTQSSGSVTQPFTIAGWAIDRDVEADSGVDYVEVWARANVSSATPFLIGQATKVDRPDVAAAYGSQYLHSGFSIAVHGLLPAEYDFDVYAHSEVTHHFEATQSFTVDIANGLQLSLDQPGDGAAVAASFVVSGWTFDAAAATGTGVDAVHVWAFPSAGGPGMFVGMANAFTARGDVGATFGAQFTNSGFYIPVTGLPTGAYRLFVYPHSAVTNAFGPPRALSVTVTPAVPMMGLDSPSDGSDTGTTFTVAGWAFDRTVASGTGVDAVHVWAWPTSGAAPMLLGTATLGVPRGDVGAAFGGQFNNSGFTLTATLPSGSYRIVAYMHDTTTNSFSLAREATINVGGPLTSIDAPTNGVTLSEPFDVQGWSIDRRASSGTGIDALHLWAFPTNGGAPVFVGVATWSARNDVAAFYGSQFTNSGFDVVVSGLPAGSYDLAAYPHSSVTGTFLAPHFVHVTIQ